MVRPKTLNKEILNEFRSDYDKLTKNKYFEPFKSIIIQCFTCSSNIAVDFHNNHFKEIAREIFANTNIKEYEKQKYYIKHYFAAVYLNKFREKLLNGEFIPNERYNDFLNESKNVKINLFDKIKLRLTSDKFFDYLANKYYYFYSEAEIELYKKIIYGSSRFKHFKFWEKFLFLNKYRAFAVMQDYYYNAKRIAQNEFRAAITTARMENRSKNRYLRKLELMLELMPAIILIMAIAYTIMHHIYI